jgi:hypothetical protein
MRILIAAGVAVAALVLPSASSAAVRDCDRAVDFNIHISSARNMTCRAAAKEQRSYKGSIKRSFDTPGGFDCHRVSGTRLGGQWRCVKHSRAYRFEFGD